MYENVLYRTNKNPFPSSPSPFSSISEKPPAQIRPHPQLPNQLPHLLIPLLRPPLKLRHVLPHPHAVPPGLRQREPLLPPRIDVRQHENGVQRRAVAQPVPGAGRSRSRSSGGSGDGDGRGGARGVRVAARRAHDLVPDPGDARAERVAYLHRARFLGPVWVLVARAEMRKYVVWLRLGMGGKASMETQIVTLEAMNRNLLLGWYRKGGGRRWLWAFRRCRKASRGRCV